MNKDPFEEYIRHKEPEKLKKAMPGRQQSDCRQWTESKPPNT